MFYTTALHRAHASATMSVDLGEVLSRDIQLECQLACRVSNVIAYNSQRSCCTVLSSVFTNQSLPLSRALYCML